MGLAAHRAGRFIEAVDDQLLRLVVAPSDGDPLAGNLRDRPELGLLVLDLARGSGHPRPPRSR